MTKSVNRRSPQKLTLERTIRHGQRVNHLGHNSGSSLNNQLNLVKKEFIPATITLGFLIRGGHIWWVQNRVNCLVTIKDPTRHALPCQTSAFTLTHNTLRNFWGPALISTIWSHQEPNFSRSPSFDESHLSVVSRPPTGL